MRSTTTAKIASRVPAAALHRPSRHGRTSKGVSVAATIAPPAPSTPKRVYNFAAGPACLPLEVLQQAQADLLSFAGSGMSVMEMSHRSKEFDGIIQTAEADLRKLLSIPDNYKVLFLQGGASTAFAMLPLNLTAPGDTADYIVTGAWSKKAFEEGKKLGINANLAAKGDNKSVPPRGEWKLTPGAKYVHYCDNETIGGVEFNGAPDVGGAPLIADMSSNYLSKPVDVSKYAMIYGGAQKNIGPAGVTIAIVRDDLIGHARCAFGGWGVFVLNAFGLAGGDFGCGQARTTSTLKTTLFMQPP
jgi:phosphoserine aminotransferase